MSDTGNNNFNKEALACLYMRPVLEMRSSIMGSADLRAEWMAEYGIETGEEEQEELMAPAEIKRTPSRSLAYKRESNDQGGWLT